MFSTKITVKACTNPIKTINISHLSCSITKHVTDQLGLHRRMLEFFLMFLRCSFGWA
jgi:hypothetical protein